MESTCTVAPEAEVEAVWMAKNAPGRKWVLSADKAFICSDVRVWTISTQPSEALWL